jgi:hypothetical protein
MGFFAEFNKNRAIKSYILKLPNLLIRTYGKSQKYTPEQIIAVAEDYKLNLKQIGFAMAMFSTKHNFDSYVQKSGLKWKYKVMRREVADKYFGGQVGFEIIHTKPSLYKGKADGDLWRSEL